MRIPAIYLPLFRPHMSFAATSDRSKRKIAFHVESNDMVDRKYVPSHQLDIYTNRVRDRIQHVFLHRKPRRHIGLYSLRVSSVCQKNAMCVLKKNKRT